MRASNRFTTSGLTAGIDWRAMEDLIVGAAVGYGADRTQVGSNGTRSTANSVSAMLYASFKPFDPWFIDAAIGYGKLDYDNRRWVAANFATVGGSRNGGYWFGAISSGFEIKYDAMRLTPYVRADFMSAQLDAYSERGPSAELLTYKSMEFRTLAGTLGLRGSYDIPMGWGTLTPMARVEYRHAFDGSFQQSMYYTDLGPSMTSTLSQASAARGAVTTSLGLRARALNGLSAELEYGTQNASGRAQSQTVRAGLKMAF